MDFRILGPLDVRDGDRELALGGRGSEAWSTSSLSDDRLGQVRLPREGPAAPPDPR